MKHFALGIQPPRSRFGLVFAGQRHSLNGIGVKSYRFGMTPPMAVFRGIPELFGIGTAFAISLSGVLA